MNPVRSVFTYVVVTITISYAFYAVLLTTGLVEPARSYVSDVGSAPVMVLIFAAGQIPGLVALLLNRRRGDDAPKDTRFWPGIGWVLFAVVFAHGMVIASYLLQSLFGLAEADWSVSRLQEQLPSPAEMGLSVNIAAGGYIFLALVATVLQGLLYAPLCVLSEWGWRGYLYRGLLPMGRLQASVFTGIVWGFWFAPLVANGLLAGPIVASSLIRCFLMTIAVGTVLSELYRRSESLLVPSVICGAWLAHVPGFWYYLMPEQRFPYTGMVGWVSVIVWATAALLLIGWPGGSNSWAEDPPTRWRPMPAEGDAQGNAGAKEA